MKLLNMKIENCWDCPFREYDADYGRSYAGGHNCIHDNAPKTRIIDDFELEEQEEKCRKQHKKIINDIKIPEWCPLEDVE